MGQQKFTAGDYVYVPHRYGNGLEKRRLGQVIKVGADGVHVRFDDDGSDLWLPAGRVRSAPAEPTGPTGLRVVEPPPDPSPAPRPPAATPAAAGPEPRATPAPAEVAAARSLIDSLGGEALSVWRRMGEQLRVVARERVERSRAALAEAHELARSCEEDLRRAEADLAAIEGPGGDHA